jgi:hypothetical protein
MVDTAQRFEEIEGVVSELRRADGDGISIVLVGSAARNLLTDESDIDLMLIGTTRPAVPKSFPGFHIQSSSVAEFLRNLQSGEDFEIWCVRLGIPLYDDGQWARIVASDEAKQWPRWELKVSHGARRLFLAGNLLEMGDNEAAAEELVYTLGHIARALLLQAGVFPLSRPELAGQLRALGYPHLATVHEQLRGFEVNSRLVVRALAYSKRLLCHLDRRVYAACADEQWSRAKLKSRRGQ